MKDKFFGVVEGFYREPYTFKQRLDLISFLSDLGLNTYVYGPKADPFHRTSWHKPYPVRTLKEFKKLNERCRKYAIHFNYALSPMSKPNTEKILKKINAMMRIGITDFSLFYDDIEVPRTKETAEAQIETANRLYDFLRDNITNPTLFFCPTQYCGFDKTEYILTISKKLHKNIHIFWTGNRIVAKKITARHVDKMKTIIRRSPLVWDNFFANDYVPRIIFKFPYRNREPAIVQKVRGILINPMNEYYQSKPLIYTAAKFFKDPYGYHARRAWREAKSIREMTNNDK